MLKVASFDIVFQEIPGEVTLALNLSNCPCHCPGCHSPHLAEDIGEEMTESLMNGLLDRYGSMITCVCFMGGDQAPEEVAQWAEYIKGLSVKRSVSASGLSSVNPKDGLKTAWYSGRPHLPECLSANDSERSVSETVCPLSGVAGPFDYIKLGPYIESLGGLKSPTTNQRLYKRVGDCWKDITATFWRSNFE